MKKQYSHDAFDCPLTKRGYLLEISFLKATQPYIMTRFDLPMLYVASVLYLYGADFSGIFHGFTGKVPKGFDDVLGYKRTPSMDFSFYNEPIIHRKNETKTISNEIIKIGYDFWYPYISWATPQGRKIRSAVNPSLEKQAKTPEMINWIKKQEKLSEIVSSWYKDFLKTIKGKYDFDFTLFIYETNLRFTITDKKLKGMSGKQISARQKEYSKLFNDFAEYLYKGFLSKEEGFPKCLYE